MPMPIAPIAAIAARYGVVALGAYALARRIPKAPRDQIIEDKFDQVPEGVSFRRDEEQFNGMGRFSRLVRLGKTGPGLELEATGLARLKFKRIRRS